MGKYRLIKEYPGSPDIDTEVGVIKGHSANYNYSIGDKRYCVLKDHVENNPYYWAKIEEVCFVVSEIDYNQGNYTYFEAWNVYKIYEDMSRDSILNYFKTKEEAEEFVIKNKPCLTLTDVSLILGGLDKKRDVYLELKRIVKSKL